MKKLLLTVVILVFISTTSAFSENDGGYYDKDLNFLVNGGLGFGYAGYGISKDEDNYPDSGGGSAGMHVSLNGLVNYSILGLELSYNRASLNDTKYETEVNGTKYEIESKGSGKYESIDIKLGLFFATEPEDMGYTFIYGGYRKWIGQYDADEVRVDGTVSTDPDFLIDSRIEGSGYIFGYRDFSTIPIPLSSTAIIIRTGLWIVSAPGDSVTINGDKENYKDSKGFGIGFEIGAGLAQEDLGLAIDIRLRADGTVTYGELENDTDFSAAYGSYSYILSVSYAL